MSRIVRVPPPAAPVSGSGDGLAGQATWLAAEWSGRLGGVPVTVFTAATVLTAGNRVAARGGRAALWAVSSWPEAGVALADAMPGQLVPVARPASPLTAE